jgi:hypothetical protein
MNPSVGRRDEECYCKDQYLLQGSLVTKERALFKFEKLTM